MARLSFYFSVVGVAIFLVLVLQLSLLSQHGLDVNGWNNLQPRDEKTAEYRKAQWIKLIQLRSDPTWDTTADGAMIHMGKTAGSSISKQLVNGCHSFMPKPCRTVPNESMASKKVKTYFHVPDFGLIPREQHAFYIVTARDPFDRFVSAFVFEHLDNWLARGDQLSEQGEEAKAVAYRCFSSLESFVEYLGDNPTEFDYPFHHAIMETANCTNFARAILHSRVRRFNHMFFNYERIRSLLPDDQPLIFVTRQEHLWYDWRKINYMLGQQEDLVIPPDANARNLTTVFQPVTRDLSPLGRTRLCKALEPEYHHYIRLLRESINLNDDDLKESLQQAGRTCPNIQLSS